jgi:hypothetical protein
MPRRSSDPIKAGVRKAKAQRRVGQGAACTQCGESRPEALVARSRPKLCVQCYAVRRCKKRTETNHIAGKANSPITVEVPTNDHRMLSDAQYEWPPNVLQNPDGRPVLKAAGFIAGAADFIQDLIVRGMRSVVDFLQKLDAWLCEKVGRFWWKGSDFEGWQPG